MRRSMTIALVAATTAALWALPASAQTFIFSTGWENAPSTGCSFENLTDNVGFANDYGPASSCDVPIVEVVDDEMNSGAKSLRVNMLPDFGTNGPDFRIGGGLGGNRSIAYIRWYQKFSADYFFRQSDHKMVIWGPADGGQHYYFQLRGDAGNETAHIALHVIPYDGLWESTNITVTRGEWHLFEARVQYGSGGGLELRVDGTTVELAEQSSTGIDLGNFDPGEGIGYVKWDTTYNGYDDPAVQAATPFFTWIDDFAACEDTWCGAVGSSSGPSSSASSGSGSASGGTGGASSSGGPAGGTSASGPSGGSDTSGAGAGGPGGSSADNDGASGDDGGCAMSPAGRATSGPALALALLLLCSARRGARSISARQIRIRTTRRSRRSVGDHRG